MDDIHSTKRGGIGVIGLLGVAFIILKLCAVINWSWWWVLAPFWIPLAIVLFVFLLAFLMAIIRR
jgi:phosphoglycerol transferase MdoB-like AlkP superfamily enzyme